MRSLFSWVHYQYWKMDYAIARAGLMEAAVYQSTLVRAQRLRQMPGRPQVPKSGT